MAESLGEEGGVRGTHLLTHVNVDHLAPLPAPPAGRTAPAALPKGKRSALLKGIVTTLKAAIKGKKRWHAGEI